MPAPHLIGTGRALLHNPSAGAAGAAGLAYDLATPLDVAAAGGSATFTWSHTCTGSNLVLVVNAGLRQTSGPTVTGVTYNTVALTAVPNTAINSDGFRSLSWWYLIAPATGAHNVVVTYSANVTAGRRFMGTAISFTGGHQSSPVSGGATTSGSLNSTTLTISSATGELVLSACIVAPTDPATNPLTGAAGQTDRSTFNTGISGTNDLRGATSQKAGAASVGNSWTSGQTSSGLYSGFSLAPAP